MHWLFLSLSFLFALPSAAQSAVDGDWVFRMEGDPTPQRVVLESAQDSVRGRVYGYPFVGTLDRDQLAFQVGGYAWTGTLDGDALSGWIVTDSDSSRWTGERFRLPEAPRGFAHTPEAYYRALASGGDPALTIYPRDTVRTTTVDAAGWSTGGYRESGNRVTAGGNPLTGPFYVEGTLPGDILAVTLHRVRLNRDWAFSGDAIMSNVLDARTIREREIEGNLIQWVLDPETGTARLQTPTPALADYEVPLTPFVGSIGVASGGEVAMSSRDSGPNGGNMEYNQIREGATVYLPVQAEGAYLYLGDGHAVQGDGELTGDALETSLDVTFSVDVLRYRFRNVPRVENERSIASIGIAGSLDQAIQKATSDLVRWLKADFDLTDTEAALVMGTAVQYDIPDIVPPWVSVAARIDRDALSTLSD